MQFGGPEKTQVLDAVDSTNEYAKIRARTGAASGTVVWAYQQTAGKGTRNRTWESPKGNVYWSGIVQSKDIGDAPFTELVYVNAVAVYHAITRCIGAEAQLAIKWPNDILLHEKKVAGSLLECGSFDHGGKPGWIVIGTGINVALSPRLPAMLYPPTSLQESGYAVTREALIEALHASLEHEIAQWLQHGFKTLRDAYLAKAFRLHEEIAISISRDKAVYVTGRYEGIDENGCIILVGADNRIKKMHSGDLFVRTGDR
ncbi:MAG: biotin--[acetyl-CoA-carboxylase] ligase [Treponema sp.]|jgi:BirA family biotin operon repressor/biotin-[acetyl-CoA-carboxylase] ligase|nr:biotin--[acetyl-CoA-carboxylase] ligase [Treponema sp.]